MQWVHPTPGHWWGCSESRFWEEAFPPWAGGTGGAGNREVTWKRGLLGGEGKGAEREGGREEEKKREGER